MIHLQVVVLPWARWHHPAAPRDIAVDDVHLLDPKQLYRAVGTVAHGDVLKPDIDSKPSFRRPETQFPHESVHAQAVAAPRQYSDRARPAGVSPPSITKSRSTTSCMSGSALTIAASLPLSPDRERARSRCPFPQSSLRSAVSGLPAAYAVPPQGPACRHRFALSLSSASWIDFPGATVMSAGCLRRPSA